MKKPTRKNEVRPEDPAEVGGSKPAGESLRESDGIVRDPTARNQAEQALGSTLALYRQIVENAADLVTVVDSEGRLTFANRRAQSAFGFPPDGLMGQLVFDFVHPGDRERTVRWFASTSAAQETEASIENRLVGLDGNVHHLRWICNWQYDTQGQVQRLCTRGSCWVWLG